MPQHRQSLLSTHGRSRGRSCSCDILCIHLLPRGWACRGRDGQDGQRSTSNRNSLYPCPAHIFHIISYFLFSSFPSFWLRSEVEAPKCHQQSCLGSRGAHSSWESPFSPRYQSDIVGWRLKTFDIGIPGLRVSSEPKQISNVELSPQLARTAVEWLCACTGSFAPPSFQCPHVYSHSEDWPLRSLKNRHKLARKSGSFAGSWKDTAVMDQQGTNRAVPGCASSSGCVCRHGAAQALATGILCSVQSFCAQL